MLSFCLKSFPMISLTAEGVCRGAQCNRVWFCHTGCRSGPGEDQNEHQVAADKQTGNPELVQQSERRSNAVTKVFWRFSVVLGFFWKKRVAIL